MVPKNSFRLRFHAPIVSGYLPKRYMPTGLKIKNSRDIIPIHLPSFPRASPRYMSLRGAKKRTVGSKNGAEVFKYPVSIACHLSRVEQWRSHYMLTDVTA